MRIKDGDLWDGLKYLSQFIEKQRLWIQVVSSPKDSDFDRLELCQRLALGAVARCELGQFSGALEWFSEALEKFNLVDTNARIEELGLGDSILVGIAGCLLLEFRYGDAEKFIDDVRVSCAHTSNPSVATARYTSRLRAEAALLPAGLCFCAEGISLSNEIQGNSLNSVAAVIG